MKLRTRKLDLGSDGYRRKLKFTGMQAETKRAKTGPGGLSDRGQLVGVIQFQIMCNYYGSQCTQWCVLKAGNELKLAEEAHRHIPTFPFHKFSTA